MPANEEERKPAAYFTALVKCFKLFIPGCSTAFPLEPHPHDFHWSTCGDSGGWTVTHHLSVKGNYTLLSRLVLLRASLSPTLSPNPSLHSLAEFNSKKNLGGGLVRYQNALDVPATAAQWIDHFIVFNADKGQNMLNQQNSRFEDNERIVMTPQYRLCVQRSNILKRTLASLLSIMADDATLHRDVYLADPSSAALFRSSVRTYFDFSSKAEGGYELSAASIALLKPVVP